VSATAQSFSLMHNLPALQVVVPLVSAPLCFLIGQIGRDSTTRRASAEAAWWVALVVSAVTLAMSLGLANMVVNGDVISYAMGGWPPPWGIEYRIDSMTAIALLIVSGINLFTVVYARAATRREVHEERHGLFYTAWLLCVSGMLGICATGDIFNVFVFLEISSLSSYILISSGRNRLGLLAAYRYLILGTVGATFFLIGVGLLYGLTGTLNMADMAVRLQSVQSGATLPAAFAFLGIGIAVKMALFPLHAWMPESYTYAPSHVSAMLAGTATKVSVYLLLRCMLMVLGPDLAVDQYRLDLLLIPVAVVAILFGSLAACWQANAKRIMAWSSVAQIGYMALGISVASATGFTAALLHMYNHALMKAALFMAIGCLFWRVGSAHADHLAGMGRRMPWTFMALVLGGLSLIGVPLTAGFVSKWYLVLAVIEKDWWLLVAVIIISSLLAVVYVGRLVETLWFREPGPDAPHGEAPLGLLLPTWALVLANIYFGIFTDLPVDIARTAAAALSGGGA